MLANHTVSFGQVYYGKYLATPQGSIIAGSGYQHTGWSRGVTPTILKHCQPTCLGLNRSSSSGWTDYPWAKGGYVLSSFKADSSHYLIGGRICSHPENENAKGRLFTHGHYLTLPVTQLSQVKLPALINHLSEVPLTKDDLPLLPLDVVAEDMALDRDWFDAIAPILEALFHGKPFESSDTDVCSKEMFKQFCIALHCLPLALRWRVSIGSGLMTSHGYQLSQTRHSQRSHQPTRRLFHSPSVSSVRYINWLAVQEATSMKDLDTLVSFGLPLWSSWNSIKPGYSWSKSIKLLNKYLKSHSPTYILKSAPVKQQKPAIEKVSNPVLPLDIMLHSETNPEHLIERWLPFLIKSHLYSDFQDELNDKKSILLFYFAFQSLKPNWTLTQIKSIAEGKPEQYLMALLKALIRLCKKQEYSFAQVSAITQNNDIPLEKPRRWISQVILLMNYSPDDFNNLLKKVWHD